VSIAGIERVVALVERGSRRDGRRLRRLLDAARRAPEHVQPRLLAAVVVVEPALAAVCPSAYDGPLCPAYPHAPPEFAARIALGERPCQVLRGLTPREAHRALQSGLSAVDWILRDFPDVDRVSSVAVARWLAACLWDPQRSEALHRMREEHTPAGVIRGCYLDRVDELRASDLEGGERTGVERAFRAASARIYADWCSAHERDETALASTPRWWREYRCARLCMSRASLIREGRQMAHCVGTYAPHVANRKCVIVSIAVRDGVGNIHRSTAELSRNDAAVVQHKGRNNAPPPALCQRALEVLSRRWQETCHG